MQNIEKWIEDVEEQISTGLEILRLGGNILEGEEVDGLDANGCRELWRELQQATLEVHWTLATMQVRLDQVKSGRALVHPHSFRPAAPQL
jgi:hypothetical protein